MLNCFDHHAIFSHPASRRVAAMDYPKAVTQCPFLFSVYSIVCFSMIYLALLSSGRIQIQPDHSL